MEKRELHSVLTDFFNERLIQATASGRARGCGKGRRRGHFVKKEQKPYGKDR